MIYLGKAPVACWHGLSLGVPIRFPLHCVVCTPGLSGWAKPSLAERNVSHFPTDETKRQGVTFASACESDQSPRDSEPACLGVGNTKAGFGRGSRLNLWRVFVHPGLSPCLAG